MAGAKKRAAQKSKATGASSDVSKNSSQPIQSPAATGSSPKRPSDVPSPRKVTPSSVSQLDGSQDPKADGIANHPRFTRIEGLGITDWAKARGVSEVTAISPITFALTSQSAASSLPDEHTHSPAIMHSSPQRVAKHYSLLRTGSPAASRPHISLRKRSLPAKPRQRLASIGPLRVSHAHLCRIRRQAAAFRWKLSASRKRSRNRPFGRIYTFCLSLLNLVPHHSCFHTTVGRALVPSPFWLSQSTAPLAKPSLHTSFLDHASQEIREDPLPLGSRD